MSHYAHGIIKWCKVQQLFYMEVSRELLDENLGTPLILFFTKNLNGNSVKKCVFLFLNIMYIFIIYK